MNKQVISTTQKKSKLYHLYLLVYIHDIGNVAEYPPYILSTQYRTTSQCGTLQWLLEHLPCTPQCQYKQSTKTENVGSHYIL